MEEYCALFNPYSGNKKGEMYAKNLSNILPNLNIKYLSMPNITDFKKLLKKYKNIIICGGDGTLNYFINKIKNDLKNNKIFYYSTGSGNDFYNETGNKINEPYEITKYLMKLPTLKVNKKEYRYLNGVGLGFDGYCCYQGDLYKKKKNKPVNYTKYALKGLLYDYKPMSAKIRIDNKIYHFNNVWMISVMNGKFYGGGMKIAPNQDRLNSTNMQTIVILYGRNRLRMLLSFPSIFKGNHIYKEKFVKVLTGYNIKIEFENKTHLQYDGETISNVKSYQVVSNKN